MVSYTCCFRKCHGSKHRYPRLHLFRFPLKDPRRVKEWMIYSQVYNEAKAKRALICARHFRMECFMNYKMDKLTRYATPTLIRLSEDKALDFELDIDKGVLITLEQTTLEHLIPPDDFESPLHIEHDKILLHMLKTYEHSAAFKRTKECATNETENTRLNRVQPQPTQLPSSTSKKCDLTDSVKPKEVKILNSALCSQINESSKEVAIVLPSQPLKNDRNHIKVSIEFENFEDENVSLLDSKPPDSDSTDSVKQHDMYFKVKNEEENDYLRLKIHLLKEENSLLRESCKETNKALRKNLLLFKMRNNQMVQILKKQKALKKVIDRYREENGKLEEENKSIEILKTELLLSIKETERLKKMVESFKSRELNGTGEFKQEPLFAKSELSPIEINSTIIKKEMDA